MSQYAESSEQKSPQEQKSLIGNVLGVTQGELVVARPGKYAYTTLATSEANPCVIIAGNWHDGKGGFGTALTHIDDQADVEQTIKLLITELQLPNKTYPTLTVASGNNKTALWNRVKAELDDIDFVVDEYEVSEQLAIDIASGEISFKFESKGIYSNDLLARLKTRQLLCEKVQGTKKLLPTSVTWTLQ